MRDIIFYTHASKQTGFGHASRCAKLAYILKTMDPNLSLCFSGDFTKKAKGLIKKISKFDIKFISNGHSKLIFYDRMDDIQDPEFISQENIISLKRSCKKIIIMANGKNIPKINRDDLCIGYKLPIKNINLKNIFWDLKYSPVHWPNTKCIIKENKQQVLIAFGGGFNKNDIDNVLSSLINIKQIKIIKVLLSPVNNEYRFYKENEKNLLSRRILKI